MMLASPAASPFARSALELRFVPALPFTPTPLAVRGQAVLAVGLAIFAWYVIVGPLMLAEPDMLWHIETGKRILESHQFPKVDAYSWTMAGAPWMAKEWGSQALYAIALRFGGWIGVVALASAAVAGALALVFAELSRRLPLVWSLGLTIAVALVADYVVVARPHVLAWPLFVGWTILLLRAAEEARTPPLWSLALMVLWTNLHGSFLIGLALLAPFALEAVMRAPERRLALALRWTLFGALAVLSTLAHAYGPGALTSAFSVLDLGEALRHMNEWKQQDFSSLSPFELFVIGGVAAALYSGLKVPLPRLLLLALLLHMGFAHIRHQSLFAFVTALTLAGPIGERLGPSKISRWLEKRLDLAVLTGALLVAAALFNATQSPIYRPAPHPTPEQALSAARAAGVAGPDGRVFNNYYFGGFLISQHVPTFIDGRAEFFGAKRIEAYHEGLETTDPEKMRRFADDNGFTWTLLKPDDSAVAIFDRLEGWRRLYGDDFAVVHVRKGG